MVSIPFCHGVGSSDNHRMHRCFMRKGGPLGLAAPIFSFSLSSLEPKSLRMVILTIILVQVLCCHSITKITRNGINGAMFVTRRYKDDISTKSQRTHKLEGPRPPCRSRRRHRKPHRATTVRLPLCSPSSLSPELGRKPGTSKEGGGGVSRPGSPRRRSALGVIRPTKTHVPYLTYKSFNLWK